MVVDQRYTGKQNLFEHGKGLNMPRIRIFMRFGKCSLTLTVFSSPEIPQAFLDGVTEALYWRFPNNANNFRNMQIIPVAANICIPAAHMLHAKNILMSNV